MSKWLPEALKTLYSLKGIPDDWHDWPDGPEPPNETAIELSEKVLAVMSNCDARPGRISPSTDEAVCMSYKNGRRYADIECYNNGEIVAIISDGKDWSEIWEVDENSIQSSVEKIRDYMADEKGMA